MATRFGRPNCALTIFSTWRHKRLAGTSYSMSSTGRQRQRGHKKRQSSSMCSFESVKPGRTHLVAVRYPDIRLQSPDATPVRYQRCNKPRVSLPSIGVRIAQLAEPHGAESHRVYGI